MDRKSLLVYALLYAGRSVSRNMSQNMSTAACRTCASSAVVTMIVNSKEIMNTDTTGIVPTRSWPRRFVRWMQYLLAGFAILLVVLACAGAIYEGIASYRDARRFHPAGRLVDIGGYRLHLYCTGQG